MLMLLLMMITATTTIYDDDSTLCRSKIFQIQFSFQTKTKKEAGTAMKEVDEASYFNTVSVHFTNLFTIWITHWDNVLFLVCLRCFLMVRMRELKLLLLLSQNSYIPEIVYTPSSSSSPLFLYDFPIYLYGWTDRKGRNVLLACEKLHHTHHTQTSINPAAVDRTTHPSGSGSF